MNEALEGEAFGLLGSVAYGATVVLNRSLARDHVGSAPALGFRFGFAALILLSALVLSRTQLLPPRGERMRIVLLGAVGYATESTFFFAGLERGTAAAVGLIFYSYPAMVTLLEAATGGGLPSWPVVGALGLSVAGTALVVITGSSISITGAGALCALASALAFSI